MQPIAELDSSPKTTLARVAPTVAAVTSIARDSEGQRDRVVREIIRGLHEGRYEPGQRLKEADLIAAHGASRGTIREALNSLTAMGIIELTQQRGAQVRLLTVHEAIDMLMVFERLYAFAANLAAQHIDHPGAREMLKSVLDTLVAFDPSNGTMEHAVARDSFYEVLTNIAGNAELGRILSTARGSLFRVQFRIVLRPADRRRHADYRRVAEAIFSGRPSAAEAAMRLHVRRAIDALIVFRDANAS